MGAGNIFKSVRIKNGTFFLFQRRYLRTPPIDEMRPSPSPSATGKVKVEVRTKL